MYNSNIQLNPICHEWFSNQIPGRSRYPRDVERCEWRSGGARVLAERGSIAPARALTVSPDNVAEGQSHF